jgi:hypothetical protein
MARTYIVQSWVGAAAGDEYSGEQIGNRAGRSVNLSEYENHFKGNSANLSFYADSPSEKKSVKKRSIVERVCLAEGNYSRLETMSLELEREYKNGNIPTDVYWYARQKMDERLEKGFARLAKERGWTEENSEEFEEITEKPKKLSKKVDKPSDTFVKWQQGGMFRGVEDQDSLMMFFVAFEKILTISIKKLKGIFACLVR